MSKPTIDRRDFLKVGLAGAAVVAVGPRLFRGKMVPASEAPTGESKHRWAMVVDQAKCTGCGHCVLACKANNDINPDMAWSRIVEGPPVGDQPTFLPVQCMHCKDAPCVNICPVKATYHRPDGIVMMNYERCIGCRYCEMACPYGARAFNWEAFEERNPAVPEWGQPDVARRPRGVVEKCSFCYQRIDLGLERGLTPGVDPEATPACVGACAYGARVFGDLNDPESPVSKVLAGHHSFRLREELGTEPRIYYLPVRSALATEEVSS